MCHGARADHAAHRLSRVTSDRMEGVALRYSLYPWKKLPLPFHACYIALAPCRRVMRRVQPMHDD